jgi:integrase
MACGKRKGWKKEGIKVRQKKRGGPWWVFLTVNGNRTSKCVGEDRAAADALADEWRAGMKLLEVMPSATVEDYQRVGALPKVTLTASGITFGEYAERFLKRNAPSDDPEHGLKRSTWEDYQSALKCHIKPVFGPMMLDAIRRRDIIAFRDTLREQGLRTRNIEKQVRVLSSILTEAADEELIAANPTPRASKDRRRAKARAATQKTKANPFTAEELAHLLTTALTYTVERAGKIVYPFRAHFPLLLTLARTGMRWGECIALQWRDIDWRGGFVRVCRDYVKRELSVTKSGKEREVHLSPQVLTTLRAVYEERFAKVSAIDAEQQAALEAAQAEKASTALIFPNEDGGYLNGDNFRPRIWTPLLTAAKLSHHRIHDLRHTASSLLYAAGADPKSVQAQLGHSSVTMTLDVYTHHRRRVVDLLDDPAPKCAQNAPDAENAQAEAAGAGGLR